MIDITQVHNVAKRIRNGRATRELVPRFIDGLILEKDHQLTEQAPAGKTCSLLDHNNHARRAQSWEQE